MPSLIKFFNATKVMIKFKRKILVISDGIHSVAKATTNSLLAMAFPSLIIVISDGFSIANNQLSYH